MPRETIVRMSPIQIRRSLRQRVAIACLALAGAGLIPSANAAPTYTVLYSFTGKPNDGAYGYGKLVQDAAGNLYGTTSGGGPYDLGTAFKIDTAGNETVLTDFSYNADFPLQGLIVHKASLYDVVLFGGYYNGGAVVKINDKGNLDLLYSFCSLANCADGAYPQYGVTRDGAGNLYGTTNGGGAYNQGTVFKVDSGGNETVLYSFCPNGGNCNDGDLPLSAGVDRDSVGNLYGFAQGASTGAGVVWKLDTSGNESVLHTFTGSPSDGVRPEGLLVMDGAGSLYGITNAGGSGTSCNGGCGTVFKVDANGNETVLHNFTGGADGATPSAQALVLDRNGNLYGTALGGGAYGQGTVFKLTPSGKLKVLYGFQGQSDGGSPGNGLLLKQDALYGETNSGGDLSCAEGSGGGCGVVFKITTQ